MYVYNKYKLERNLKYVMEKKRRKEGGETGREREPKKERERETKG